MRRISIDPDTDQEWRDETSFPLRFRLNMWAEAVPDLVDVYLRLTMNKRWGAWDSSISSSSDPFDKPNSLEASAGHDLIFRLEQAYATLKVAPVRSTWYIGILPGLDGPPSRQTGSLFPRPFIDSEIDGTLIKWDAPPTSLDDRELPWTETRLWRGSLDTATGSKEAGIKREFSSRRAYEAKAERRPGLWWATSSMMRKKSPLRKRLGCLPWTGSAQGRKSYVPDPGWPLHDALAYAVWQRRERGRGGKIGRPHRLLLPALMLTRNSWGSRSTVPIITAILRSRNTLGAQTQPRVRLREPICPGICGS